MGKFIMVVCLVVLCSSLGYGFLSMPLDSPVVVDYTTTGGSTGINQGRGTARDSHGWIYAVYVAGDSFTIRCSRSTDNGRSWSRFADLYKPWGAYPNIVIDRGDSIYVAWERLYVDTLGWDIYFSKYNGISWTPPVNVSNQHVQGTTESSSLALDGSGNLHLTWSVSNIWYSYYANNVWSTPVAVTPSGQWVASMCADTANNLHLAWQGGNVLYKKRSGGVWDTSETASPTSGWQPCIVVDNLLRPHVAYQGFGGRMLHIRRDSSGWTFPDSVSGDSIGHDPSITCDKHGHLYVVWGGPESLQKLWYATYDGTAWSAPVRLRNDTAYADYACRLGFPVSDSGVDLIWTRDRGGGSYNVMYWRLPLLPVGVERGQVIPSPLSPLPFSVVPNPFFSYASVSGREKERFSLYDIAGRKVGVYQGNRVGVGLPSGVYFLKPVGQDAKPLRIVKLR